MVTPITQATSTGPITQAQQRASISREQFLRILVAELTSQNPIDPLDNNAFMQQLVGLQNLEQTASLTDSLKTFERFMQMSSGSAMIGRTVRGITTNRQPVEGVVSRVVLEGGQVLLMIGQNRVPINAVTEIKPGT